MIIKVFLDMKPSQIGKLSDHFYNTFLSLFSILHAVLNSSFGGLPSKTLCKQLCE